MNIFVKHKLNFFKFSFFKLKVENSFTVSNSRQFLRSFNVMIQKKYVFYILTPSSLLFIASVLFNNRSRFVTYIVSNQIREYIFAANNNNHIITNYQQTCTKTNNKKYTFNHISKVYNITYQSYYFC